MRNDDGEIGGRKKEKTQKKMRMKKNMREPVLDPPLRINSFS